MIERNERRKGERERERSKRQQGGKRTDDTKVNALKGYKDTLKRLLDDFDRWLNFATNDMGAVH